MTGGPWGVTSSGAGPCFYREVQRFRQPWLWLLLAGIAGISLWNLGRIALQPSGDNPAADIAAAVIAALLGVGLPGLFCALNLTTEVRSDGLYYRYFPFHRSYRRIAPDSLVRFAARTYSPIRDYGGWGIRYGREGRAYNVSGNRGVMLELSGGEKLLIGSQRPDELVSAISLALGRQPGPG